MKYQKKLLIFELQIKYKKQPISSDIKPCDVSMSNICRAVLEDAEVNRHHLPILSAAPQGKYRSKFLNKCYCLL